MLAGAAHAQSHTAAGTRLVNVADLLTDQNGQTVRSSSNAVTLTVAKLLDVAVVAPVPVSAPAPDDGVTAVPFAMTNLGNGPERFTITATIDRTGVTVTGIASDDDGDGRYDPAHDSLIVDGTVTSDAGDQRRLFVLVKGAGQQPVDVALTATAATGSGRPGDVFPGADGVDAVVGPSGATATARARIAIGSEAPTLVKSQSVTAPDGSARAVPGSIVTYRLEARFPGATAASEIVDDLPTGTAFVPGSITLDGQSLTDVADTDAASFDGTTIHVRLGDIATAATHSVQFQATIK